MSNDILSKVRKEILEEEKRKSLWAPKTLNHTWEHAAGLAGATTGAVAGALFGAHMGLAGPWGAIAGTVPCTIIGGALGYFGGAKVGSKFHKPTTGSSDPAFRGMSRSVSGKKVRSLSDASHCAACGAKLPSSKHGGKSRCNKCGSY